MKIIKDTLKGFCIGIANVIPGFSGGTMAMMLHIYDRLINGLADFVHHPIKALKDLIFILLGMVIGILFAIVSISLLLKKFPFPTVMFFVGLIIGSLPGIFKESMNGNQNKLNILWMIPAIVILISLLFINSSDKTTSISPLALIVIFIIGIVAAATMVIPGISGSLTLMALGFYKVIVDDIKEIFENVLHLSNVSHEIVFIFVFVIGCLIGIILVSKMIKFLLSKYKNQVYFFIFGLMMASIFTIIYSLINSDDYDINFRSAGMWTFAIIFTMIGISIPILMEYVSKKYNKKEEIANDSTEENIQG